MFSSGSALDSDINTQVSGGDDADDAFDSRRHIDDPVDSDFGIDPKLHSAYP
jgi:hypothetical protein